MMVKICGITNREDALAAVEAGASALGFNFYSRSPRFIQPRAARRIVDELPASVLKVGIFVHEPPGDIDRILHVAGLDIVQLYGPEKMGAWRIWRACRVDSSFNTGVLNGDGAEAFLLDSASPGVYGGSGVSFDWSLARGLPQRIILAGGLTVENVRAAIDVARPWGIDACSTQL
jgi:phosphoribosylanthranilate isomerase